MGQRKRLIVCGDRSYTDYRLIESALRAERGEIESIVEGEARGADKLARMAGTVLRIPVTREEAEWKKFRKGAGPIRNGVMLQILQAYEGPKEVWAFHRSISSSKGTANMISQALQAGIPVRLYSGTGLGWTNPESSGTLVLCTKCGGEKQRPALLAYKIRCKADFHSLSGGPDAAPLLPEPPARP